MKEAKGDIAGRYKPDGEGGTDADELVKQRNMIKSSSLKRKSQKAGVKV